MHTHNNRRGCNCVVRGQKQACSSKQTSGKEAEKAMLLGEGEHGKTNKITAWVVRSVGAQAG